MVARGIHSCCPEGPSTINISQTVVTLDGTSVLTQVEQFNGSDLDQNNSVLLSLTPYSNSTVFVFYGTQALRLNLDYTVYGKELRFISDMDESDVFEVRYTAVSSGLSVDALQAGYATGTQVGYVSSTPPQGWLLMDGTTTVDSSGNAPLYAFLSANPTLTVEYAEFLTGGGNPENPDAFPNYLLGLNPLNTYTLINLRGSYYDGNNLVTTGTIIKT